MHLYEYRFTNALFILSFLLLTVNTFVNCYKVLQCCKKSTKCGSDSRGKDSLPFSIHFERLPVAIINIEQHDLFYNYLINTKMLFTFLR